MIRRAAGRSARHSCFLKPFYNFLRRPTLLPLCLPAFIRFYCVWNFLRLHKPCRNADVHREGPLQFLQAVNLSVYGPFRRRSAIGVSTGLAHRAPLIRRNDQWIMSPLSESPNCKEDKDLSQAKSTAYKPAYKEDQERREDASEKLPAELAEIVTVWPELPWAIRSAIVAIVRDSKDR